MTPKNHPEIQLHHTAAKHPPATQPQSNPTVKNTKDIPASRD